MLLLLACVPAFCQSDDLAIGKLLVASRDLGDPNFAQTVILLVHYSGDQGSVGLVLNRRTDVPLSRVFQDLKEAKGRMDPVYVGGPVELDTVLALLKTSRQTGRRLTSLRQCLSDQQQRCAQGGARVQHRRQHISRLCWLRGLGRRTTGA